MTLHISDTSLLCNDEDGVERSEARFTWYTFNCALLAAIGSLLLIDSGIISTTISHDTFGDYFARYTDDISGAVVSIFGAGSFFGVILAEWSADKWSQEDNPVRPASHLGVGTETLLSDRDARRIPHVRPNAMYYKGDNYN